MERDYAELIKNLRYCSEIGYESCAHCELYLKPSCERLKEDAADAIKELQAAVPKWISVSENQKCPVKAWSCLIGYFNGGIYNQLWWFDFAYTDQNGFIFPRNTDIEGRCVAVFALPEPPKEE